MWHKIKRGKETQIVSGLEGYDMKEWTVVHSFEDELEEFEEINDDGVRIVNKERKADTQAGPEHIHTARIMKLIEAIFITQKTPLLEQEAKTRKISLLEMAELVLAQNANLVTKENGRMSTKHKENK